MEAKDYSIMYCKDGNLYINNNRWSKFRSADSKCFSKEDLESIEKWIEKNNWYIRKDTFIEKANKWLSINMKMLMNVLDVEYDTHDTDIKDFIEDFKKYIED